MPQGNRNAQREAQFQKWYRGWAQKAVIDPNPDNPLHKYDYRAAFAAGATPRIAPEDGLYHWPSEFKAEDHPNRYVGGYDTKTGKPMPQGKKYTVQDTQTGKTVTFEWNQPTEPGDADFEEVFQAAGLREKPAPSAGRFSPYAQMGRAAVEAMSGPGRTFQKGVGQAQRGNIPAGAANISAGILQAPFTPLMGIEAGVREIPVVGKFASNLVRAPFELMGGAWDALAGQPQSEEEEAVGNLAKSVIPLMAPQIAGRAGSAVNQAVAPKVQRAGRSLMQSTAERIGAYTGAGQNVPMMRRAGQFMAEADIPLGARVSGTKIGIQKASEVASKLNDQLNTKIIDPATKAGKYVGLQPVLGVLRQMRDRFQNALPPDRAAVSAIDRLIQDTGSRMMQSERPGYLSPREAQDLKVLNNQILQSHYSRIERAGGQLSPLENVKKVGRAEANTQIRKALEEIDPQIKGINWTEGAALEVSRALDSFYQARLKRDPSLIRGSGITGAAAGRPRLVGLFALTELFAFRPFLVKWNKMLNKVGREMSGARSEFTMPSDVRGFSDAPSQPRGALPPAPTITPAPADASGLRPGAPPFVHYGTPPQTRALPPAMQRVEDIPSPGGLEPRPGPMYPPKTGGVLVPVWDPKTRQVIYISPEQALQWDARFRLPM